MNSQHIFIQTAPPEYFPSYRPLLLITGSSIIEADWLCSRRQVYLIPVIMFNVMIISSMVLLYLMERALAEGKAAI